MPDIVTTTHRPVVVERAFYRAAPEICWALALIWGIGAAWCVAFWIYVGWRVVEALS